MGLIVDAMIWDITHGGNEYSWDAMYEYVKNASNFYTLGQEAETVAAINYGITVMTAVLNQQAPAANYQTLNGDNSTAIVAQYFNSNITAESVIDQITENVKIITDAITASNPNQTLPKKIVPTTLIRVATGYYYEVLPIIVPAQCCIMGDELRATNVQPRKSSNSTLTPRKDVPFSFEGLNRVGEIVGDIVEGVAVTATSGNIVTQDQSWPYAETDVVGPQVEKLTRVIQKQIDSSIGDKISAIYKPAYELADANYGYSRDLFLANKEFIKEEIIAYIADQYPNLYYSKTKCRQDVGLIMDNVAYDLTYGGTWMSIEAGKAYFNGASGTLQIDSTEKAATLAAYEYLKQLMQTTGRNITVNPTYQTPSVVGDVSTVPVPQISGTGGSAAVSTQIGTLMDIVIDIIDNGIGSAPSVTYPTIPANSDASDAKTTLDATKTSISTETIDFINENFGSFTYDSGKFRSDITNIVTDIAFDVALGTNYNAVFNGIAHNRPANAYGIADGKVQTIGALRYLRDDVVNEVTDTAAKTATNNAFNEIVDILDNGNGSADALSYPTPSTLPTTNADDAYANLNANKAFIEAEITAWIDDQVLENTTTNPDPNSIWFNFTYDATKCARDVGYIVEAEKYDILYGGTMASTRIAESYFGPTGTAYPAGQTEQTAAAYDRLATVLDEISREVLVTKSSGNAETQTQLGSPAGTTEGNALLANLQIIEDVLTAGNTDSLPAATYPDIAALSVSATLQTEKAAIDTARPQSVLDTIQYVSDTYNDFNYIHSKCSRDVGLIIDAFIYDYALETNYAGLFSAQSYLRAPSANVVKDQKTASIAAFEFARTKVIEDLLPTATGGPIPALQYVNQTWEWVDDTVFSATPEGGKSNADQEVWNAVRQLELNKEFIVEEVVAHIDNWFKVAVTRIDSATDVLTVSDTSWMQHNQEIVFQNLDDSTDAVTNAQLDTSTTYYVKDILSDTSLTISETPGGAAKNFTTDADYFAVNIESPKLRKDFYEIIEGALYDAVFNTNYNQVALGLDFVTGDNASATTIAKSAILAGLTYAKARVAEVAELRKNATLLSRTNAAFDEVSDIVNNGAGNADALSFATTTNASLQIAANESFIAGEVLEWLNQNYNAIYTAMDTGQFTTEIGYVCDALRYDLANGGNSATHRLAERYFTGTTFIDNLDNNRTAGNLAFNYLQSFIDNIVLDDSAGWTKLSGGTQDVSNGAGSATDATNAQALVGILENAAGDGDTSNFAEKTYPLSTEANGDVVNGVMNHAERIANRAIRYVDDTYTAMFELKANYSYDKTLCKRDVREYVEAMKWDLSYPQEWHREYTDGISFYRPAAYKTKLAARYYVNAVIGSQEEDFYYLRDGTGLRLQTLDGLQGDLGPTNTYGTRRPTAGAYASLDPGWGPGDKRAWITARSPYVQNCTTFGYAAIGQKIDGALHDGGNDSIVSNDFTQVISDGIGAWITNNGRAELVSVFTYYSHVGYLAENGGRIRATNGNNSYGTWGSVAEGTDPEETAITGVVDNKFQYNATIAVVNTDADEILNTEFSHAGNDYTEAAIDFFGPGANEVIVADEFRDGAVFQVRVGETPGVTTGGAGYLVVTNTAQAGTTTSITLSATDGNISTAYIGMRVQITGGAGVGLYGIIDTYNAGSKVATVTRESDGVAGWDHVVPGFVWEQPNSTSTYLIEPYVGFTDPTKASGASTLPTSTTWYANKFIETAAEYTNVATETESDGNGATFDVIRNGSRYYLTVNNAGTGYTRLDTVTIKGSNLGGVDTTHDVTVTLTSLNANGSIVDFDFIGNGRKGFFLAAGAGSNGAISYDGINWTAQNITAPGAGNWSEIAQGLLDDGSTTFHPSSIIIVGDGTNDIARSSDGDTWTAGALPGGMSSAGEKSIAFGNVSVGVNRYVVISDDDRDVAYTEDAGQNWTLTTNALSAVGFDSITFGKGLYVAVSSGTTSASYSDNGVTWTDVVLPGTVAGNITWGNGKFIVVGGTNGVMYSLDGVNWYDPELPGQGTGLTLPLTATERQVAYGQGVFVITSDDTDEVQYSQDGLYWQAYTLTGGAVTGGFNAVAFGNPEKAGVFSILPNASGTAARYANIGATARARAGTANEQIFEFRLYEPGSGYSSAPTITITDPNNTEDVTTVVRIGTGALANPTYVNRGSGYTSSTASLDTLNSNGSADFLQSGQYIAVRRLTERPVNGSNVEFAGQSGTFYKLVSTVSFIGTNDGSYTAFLQLSPEVTITDAPADGESVEMRIRFSQVRLTGHDFLDIGTGNFADTNYPGIPVNNPDQTKETNDANGGRVFYTATDQDGNFRVGDLFSVEQATGVATLNAEAFNIAGLQELSLGEVTLGGNSASITEFSTDPFFTANSDSIVPTQRAIKAYIESQIGGGGATLVVNSVTAGDIFIGGQQITTVSGSPITIKANVIFSGTVLGYPLAWNYFQR